MFALGWDFRSGYLLLGCLLLGVFAASDVCCFRYLLHCLQEQVQTSEEGGPLLMICRTRYVLNTNDDNLLLWLRHTKI
jgi:hypothetical protein